MCFYPIFKHRMISQKKRSGHIFLAFSNRVYYQLRGIKSPPIDYSNTHEVKIEAEHNILSNRLLIIKVCAPKNRRICH